MKRQRRETEPPYNPFLQPVAYETLLPPMAAAAVAVMKHKTLEDALHDKTAAPVDVLTILWGGHDADAAALLLTPDAQKCTPWLWLFSRQPVWKPRKAAAAPLPLTPTWFLVQTPDKKRRLHFVAAGTLRRTLHIKGKGLQEADVEPTPAAVGFVSTKKIVFYMDGKLAGTVLELATDSNGSVLPSVPSVNA
jgi:hypothetical protein